MKQLVDILFPPVAPDAVPYWRLVLRGCSQLCFQTNELTGLFFLAAVAVHSPIAAVYFLVAGLIAPAIFMFRNPNHEGVGAGLPGLNPSLVALSIATFFDVGWTTFEMWGLLLACVILTVIIVRIFLRILPFPFLILPFLLVIWGLWELEPSLGFLRPASSAPVTTESAFRPVTSVILSLGQGALSPTIPSGILFLCGVLLSNVRHAVIAMLGAAIGSLVAFYYHNVDPALVDQGLYGFNGVLAAVAAYVICGSKLRLAILGALLATMLIPVVSSFGVPSLSAPFVVATWLLLVLGWLERIWFDPPDQMAAPPASSPARVATAEPATQPSRDNRGE
jgi:urea transporter